MTCWKNRLHFSKVNYSSQLGDGCETKSFFIVATINSLGRGDNAEEFSGQIEGDMLIDEVEWAAYNGRLESTLRWPNNVVPFWINDTFFSKVLNGNFRPQN